MKHSYRYTVTGLVSLFVALAELLLTLRVILKFFNGNPEAEFIAWVYRNTETLLAPFRLLFPDAWNDVSSGWTLDFPALFAMAVYAVLGAVLIGLSGKSADRSWIDWNGGETRSKRK